MLHIHCCYSSFVFCFHCHFSFSSATVVVISVSHCKWHIFFLCTWVPENKTNKHGADAEQQRGLPCNSAVKLKCELVVFFEFKMKNAHSSTKIVHESISGTKM